ncbi:hypothetical protein BOSE62_130680 [Bosea sp. 62]|nr:hypothetical protein BOSE7B_120700 [Bosea sp. 7B]CAD5274896.1 hypothetical protein BOSE21B_30212 [Bosea sp. 21B]CAD5276052.1 hypothetical protein BOSE46_30073 [Bosea sp. 46]VVT60049.1 hypothetical protein BOS5A_210840 [Bosea sp. EC-HK365B]VXB53172.1 hypothetical protein BOSE62_130680 [Bosea sp. 62]VXC15368.1 hypothetical protein BOSE127_170341 [Bosea sp. 127]VXC16481.1 hypothetical protein BOSE29B_30202 [Bosea sp. 29B]VXC70692.1 hypothetical protein BOSE125_40074 [Bosea sp. 125]
MATTCGRCARADRADLMRPRLACLATRTLGMFHATRKVFHGSFPGIPPAAGSLTRGISLVAGTREAMHGNAQA